MKRNFSMQFALLMIVFFLYSTIYCNEGDVKEKELLEYQKKVEISFEGQTALTDALNGETITEEELQEIKKLPFDDISRFIASSIADSPHYIIKRAEKIDEWADILLDARRFDSQILQHFGEFTDELLKTRLLKGTTIFLRFNLFPGSELLAKILENALSLPSYLFYGKYFSGKALKGIAGATRWLISKVADKKSFEKDIKEEAIQESIVEKTTEERLTQKPLRSKGVASKQEIVDRLKTYIIEQEKGLLNPLEKNRFSSFFSSMTFFGDTIKSTLMQFFGDDPQSYVRRLEELQQQQKDVETIGKIKDLLDDFCKELATLLISFQAYVSLFDTFVPDQSLSIPDAVIAVFDFIQFKKSQFQTLQKAFEDFKQGALAASGTIFEPFVRDVNNKLLLIVNKASTQIVYDTLKLSKELLNIVDELQYEQKSEEELEELQKTKNEESDRYKKFFEFTRWELSEYENSLKDKISQFDSTKAIYNALVAEFDAIERGGFSTLMGSELNFRNYSIQLMALEQLADFIYTERFGLSDSVYDKDLKKQNLDYSFVENLKREINQRIQDIREFTPKEPLVNNRIDRELQLNEKIRIDKINALKVYLLLPSFAAQYPLATEQFSAILSIVDLMKHYLLMSNDLVRSIRRVLEQKMLTEDEVLQKNIRYLWLRLQVVSSQTEKDFILQEEFARIINLISFQEQKEQLAKLAFFVKEQKNKNIYLEQIINERIKQLAQMPRGILGSTPLGIKLQLAGKLPQDQGRALTDYMSILFNKIGVLKHLSKIEREELVLQLKEIKNTLEVYNLKSSNRDLFEFIDQSINLYSRDAQEKMCQITTPQKNLLFSYLQGKIMVLPADFFTSMNMNEFRNYLQEYLQCSSNYLLKNAHSLQEWGKALQEANRVKSPIITNLKKYGDTFAHSASFGYLISFLRFDLLAFSKDLALYLETFLWAPGALVAARLLPGKAVYGLGNIVEWFARKISAEQSRDLDESQQDVFNISQKIKTEVDESILKSGKSFDERSVKNAECEGVIDVVPAVLEFDRREQLEEIDRVKEFIQNQQGELLLSLEESRYKNFFKPVIDFGDSIKLVLQTKIFGKQDDSYLSQITSLEDQSFDDEHIQELSSLYQKVVQECNAIVASFKFFIALFESFIPEGELTLQESAVVTFEFINFKLTQVESLNKAIDAIKLGTQLALGTSLEFLAQDLIDRLSILVHEALVQIVAQKVEIYKKYSIYLQSWADEFK